MQRVSESLVLADSPESIRESRRFVAARLAEGRLDAVIDAGELVASELVTNAFLHGEAPVVLRVRMSDVAAVIEVRDASRRTPLRALPNSDMMTGRGLALVEQLSVEWGVRLEADGGKTVWAALSPVAGEEPVEIPDVDVDAMLASFTPDGNDVDSDWVTIILGDVPTDLLLAAKAHIDNLVREFSLAASGSASSGVEVPTDLATLIDTVVHGF